MTSNRTPSITRRTVITHTAGIAVGAGIGVGYLATRGDSAAAAAIDVDGLDIPDDHVEPDGSVTDLRVDLTASYDYDVADTDERFVGLYAGPAETALEELSLLGFDRDNDGPPDDASGTISFDESLLDADGIDLEDADPESGEVEVTAVRVALELRITRDDDSEHTAWAYRDVEVTIDREAEGFVLDIGGEGDVIVETD